MWSPGRSLASYASAAWLGVCLSLRLKRAQVGEGVQTRSVACDSSTRGDAVRRLLERVESVELLYEVVFYFVARTPRLVKPP